MANKNPDHTETVHAILLIDTTRKRPSLLDKIAKSIADIPGVYFVQRREIPQIAVRTHALTRGELDDITWRKIAKLPRIKSIDPYPLTKI